MRRQKSKLLKLVLAIVIVIPGLLSGCLSGGSTPRIEDFSITVDEGDCVAEIEFRTGEQFYLRLEGPRGILTTRHVQDTSRSGLSISFFVVREGKYTVRAMENEDGGTIESMEKDYEGPELELTDQKINYGGSGDDKVRVDLNEVQISNSGELPLEVSTIKATLSFMNERRPTQTNKERYFVDTGSPAWVSTDLSFQEVPKNTDCEVTVKFDPTYQEANSLNFNITTPS